jgi:hypothetical protein
VDFWNSAEVEIFSELIYTSDEFQAIPCTKFQGIPGKITAQNSGRNTGTRGKSYSTLFAVVGIVNIKMNKTISMIMSINVYRYLHEH